MGKIIGIDLGTTNSCVAVMEGGKPVVIPNAEGGRTTPSIVAWTKDGERLVGAVAKRQMVSNPTRTIRSIKRKMGSGERVKAGDKEYSPPEVSAMILQKLRADAESYLGADVTEAVITVPAYFNDSQRQATKDAGTIAGLDVKRIINEPTASALAYGMEKEGEGKILVYDLGGGTFDVSILEIGDGVFEVLSTSGDTELGGDDWDERLVEHLRKTFQDEHHIDLGGELAAMQRLFEAAEKAKIDLSGVQTAQISLPYLFVDTNGPKNLDVNLSRSTFQEITHDLLRRTEDPIHSALKDAGLQPGEIDRVILVGGSTRMPVVHDLIKRIFGKEAYKNINPDECVALGAAIQGGVLAGDVQDLVLLDVTPLTLGIETLGSVSTPLIERNTTIPTRKSQIFSTAADNQTQVEIHVLQGERAMAGDNNSLGRFHLMGIAPASRGIPQIEVAFDIDANGIVNVTAKDLGTGQEQKITITGSTNLSDEDINRNVTAAKSFAEEDTKRKEQAEIRNLGETSVFQTRRSLEELGDKIPDDLKERVETAITALEEVLKGDDHGSIKDRTEELSKVTQEIGAHIYSQEQAPGGEASSPGDASAPPGSTDGEPGVKDADFRVVEEDSE